ncbi:hypothetical protein [Dyadobacter sp. CY343]|uniref:hypothetical protein n=1 Tax=Dyadobacter sp. CY343 TaxID=2907299 RepID=UPI001F3A84AF|nr:hypothetical protein [Dyadobacter sp. CY343]MCE7062591.1 hypothetical protein [Dyadobacter sp. CY343]
MLLFSIVSLSGAEDELLASGVPSAPLRPTMANHKGITIRNKAQFHGKYGAMYM